MVRLLRKESTKQIWDDSLLGLAGLVLFLGIVGVSPVYGELHFAPSSGEQLDSWWSAYFDSGDTKYIQNIVEYVNSEDLLKQRLTQNIEMVQSDDRIIEVLRRLQAHTINGVIQSNYDLDTVTGVLFRAKSFQEDLKYLFSILPDKNELMVRSAVKSAAFWSLLANSRQHDDVKCFLNSITPSLKATTTYTIKTLQ
jgi:hypothetical protein